MTRKQFRKWKKQNLTNKQHQSSLQNERPEWADDEKAMTQFETWRTNFIAELKEAVKSRIDEGPQFIY